MVECKKKKPSNSDEIEIPNLANENALTSLLKSGFVLLAIKQEA